MAVDQLQMFLKKIEDKAFVPSGEEIGLLGANLVLTAKEQIGYVGLVWQVGVYLLILVSEQPEIGVDSFYQMYGYNTVANALVATLQNGDFPLGLGFIVHDFLPNDGLRGLAANRVVRRALAGLGAEHFKIPVENFRSASPELRRASALFLNHAEGFGIPAPSRLQMASALLLATPAGAQERELVTRVFLDNLVGDNRDINLFYCWFAAAEAFPELWYEPDYLNSLIRAIQRCKELGDKGQIALAHILSDRQVLSVATNDFDLLVLLGLAGWWLYTRCRLGQGLDIAWQSIFALANTFPVLSDALRDYLQIGQAGVMSPEEVESLQSDFQEAIRTLRQESRLRSYRGVSLALQMQRYNLVNVFEPLYEALEGSSVISEEVASRIRSLDALELIDGNPLQKADRYPIEGDLRMQMINDHQKILDALCRAVELRERLDHGVQTNREARLSLSDNAVKREANELLNRYPELTWAVEWFLPEVLNNDWHKE